MKKLLTLSALFGLLTQPVMAQSQRFDNVLACHNNNDEPGMAVQLTQYGKSIYKNAIGLANLDTKRPINTHDQFQIGSITKTFTAAAILKLVEQNKLSLSDPLSKFIPNIQNQYKQLTLEAILSHTSGLPDYLTDPYVTARYHEFSQLDQAIKVMSKRPLVTKPGQTYHYSNIGYVMLGKVIEVTSGLSYEDYMQNTFFKPLKMRNTFVKTKGTLLENVRGYTSHSFAPNTYLNPNFSKERQWHVDRSWIGASGAITSTLDDMAIWQKALNSGEVISKQSLNKMRTPATLNDQSATRYGLGTDVFELMGLDSISHQGMVPGYFAWHVHFPNEDLTATVLSNLDTKHPGPMLLDLVAIKLNLSPDPVSGDAAAKVAQSLVGRYQSVDSEILTISYYEGKLYSQYQGKPKRKLVPREDNAYSYECTENFFQLSENNNSLVPVDLYRGKQTPLRKL